MGVNLGLTPQTDYVEHQRHRRSLDLSKNGQFGCKESLIAIYPKYGVHWDRCDGNKIMEVKLRTLAKSSLGGRLAFSLTRCVLCAIIKTSLPRGQLSAAQVSSYLQLEDQITVPEDENIECRLRARLGGASRKDTAQTIVSAMGSSLALTFSKWPCRYLLKTV